MSGLAAVVATGDLIYLRRQRILRSVWAAAVVAPGAGGCRDHAFSALDRRGGSGDINAGKSDRAFFWRQL